MHEAIRWAHQGGAKEAPSNTLGAMRRAVQKGGATALELDVHRSRDGALVVIHDRTLDRTTDGCGKVRRAKLADLKVLDAAHWWRHGTVADHKPGPPWPLRGRAPADPDYQIPTFEEVLDEHADIPMTVEVKGWRAAAPVVDVLANRRRRNVTVTSFFTPILWLVRARLRRRPDADIGLAPALAYTVWFRLRSAVRLPPRTSRYRRIQVPVRKLGIGFASKRFVRDARRAGMRVDFWTIDDEATMHSLLRKLGVDGIMTDFPSLLATVANDRRPARRAPARRAPARASLLAALRRNL